MRQAIFSSAARSALRQARPLYRPTAMVSRSSHKCYVSVADTRSPASNVVDFHEMRERQLLQHVISRSTEGDAESVMSAMDSFWDNFFHGQGTAEWKLRGSALDQAIRAKSPKLTMEIGTYCGYSAVRLGRLLPPGAKLVSIETDPLFAAIATKVVEHAGLSESVKVLIGSVEERLPSVVSKYSADGKIDALLLDHEVGKYESDLRLLANAGLIADNTIVLCDWSLYPGSDANESAPTESQAFMKYLEETGRGAKTPGALHTIRHTLSDKDVFTVSSWSGTV